MDNDTELKIDPVRNREGSQRPSISNGIEAILFFKGEPVSIERLASVLKVSKNDIKEAIGNLKISLEGRGIVLQENDGEYLLGTHPDISNIIEDLKKEELNRELSKASLETLSIILYKNGATHAEVDYIRGVNSSFTLRALSVRGLVNREVDKKDNRRYIYKPSFNLLSFMGVKSVEELPDYAEVNNGIEISAKSLEEEMKVENESI